MSPDNLRSPALATTMARTREAHKVTLIGAGVDFAVGLAKLLVGILVGSAALVADAIHSFSDLLTDAFVLAATHFGRQAPDSDHPYGHGRIETLATLWLGGILIFVAGGIAWASVSRLISGEAIPVPGVGAILVAIAALLSKEWIFRYTLRVAKRVDSRLLQANAWHSRSDALSTAVVLIGLIGAEFGAGWLDAVAAVVVGMLVGKLGGRLLWESSRELIDTALPESDRTRMQAIAEAVNGVRNVHELRTRTLGSDTLVDLHIVVPPRVTVSEGHEIGNEVARRLRENFQRVSDVTFHIDPVNDEAEPHAERYAGLPLRRDVEHMLDEAWAGIPAWQARSALDLHYLDDEVDISLYIPELPPGQSLADAATELRAASRGLDWIGGLRLWQGPGEG